MASILFLSQSLPYPPHSGGTQRTYNVLKELQEGFDVYLVSFSRRGHQADPRQRRDAEEQLARRLTHVSPSVPYPSESRPLRRAWDHGRSLLSGHVYSRFQYNVPEFGVHLNQVLERIRPDLVHLDSIDLYVWLERLTGIPATCTHHDIESHLLQRRAKAASNTLVGRYIQHQADLMRRVEADICPRFTLNLTMSPVDSARLARIAPEARIWELPNSVDLERCPFVPVEQREPEAVVFIGPTYLFANMDAIEFLLRDIWPRVRKHRPTAHLTLVGKNAPGQKETFARIPGVIPVGWVESIQPYVGRAACSVIPIRVGGGTRIKILESWAFGTPIVTTSLGAEGLAINDGENALIRDDPAEFAEAIVNVLEDQALRKRLAQAGRSTVERLYNWKKVGNRLRQRYGEIIARHHMGRQGLGGSENND